MTAVTSLKRVLAEVDVRAGSTRLPLLSVSIHRGVIPRSEMTDDLPRADDLSNYKVCQRGDLVLNRMRAFQGAIGVSPVPGLVSPDYLVLRPRHGASTRYLHHAFRSSWFVGEMTSRIRGIGSVELGSVRTPRINADDLLAIQIPLPSDVQQQRIADFLDDQVARIDNIIAARQKQSDLLRSAFTAHCTAKLWPVVLPPTWTIDKLGRRAKIGNGSTPQRDNASYWEGGTVPWLNSSVVNLDEVEMTDQFVTQSALARCHLPMVQPGSVLVGLTGEGRTRGMATLLSMSATINQHLAFITGEEQYWQAGYLLWALRAAYRPLRNISDVNGSTKGGLTCGDLNDLRVPRPPLADQVGLVAEMESDAAKTRSATAALGQCLTRLQEFKRALITAAVTGEFDVSSADGSQVTVG